MGRYFPGAEVVIDLDFANEDGDPQDPTSATAKIRLPDGTIEDLVVTPRGVTGGFETRYVIPDDAAAGVYTVRGAGSGALRAANEHTFTVFDSQFA